jgi:large subunit ribosomal protein L15
MSHTGSSHKATFEGGQMPLVRRIPKRGFTNFTRVENIPVNLSDLERFDDGTEVTLPLLKEAGLTNGTLSSVKILGKGELTKKLTVRANAFSKSAQVAIEAKGGTCEIIS